MLSLLQRNILLLASFIGVVSNGYSQDVLINENGGKPNASAALEVESSSKGVLIPRLTTAQRNAVASPATGLLVFDSTVGAFFFYSGSAWVNLSEDNLGDHSATQNVGLNGNYLSNDGDNEGIRIDNSGNVGIGTTSPTSLLTVFGDNRSALTLQSSDNTLNHGLAFQNNGGNYTWNIFRTDAGSNDADLVFAGGSSTTNINSVTERMRINKDGELGLGTSSPTSLLHINGTPPANANSGHIQIQESTSSNTMMLGRTQTYGFAQTQNSEPLAINPLGNNVGIGTTAPNQLLHIHSGSSTVSMIQLTNSSTGQTGSDGLELVQSGGQSFIRNQENNGLHLGTNNTPRFSIEGDGDVGIGTSTPARHFHVHDGGATVNYMQMTHSASGASATDGLLVGQSGNNTFFYNYENGYMAFRTNNNERIRIESGGDVGIGLTNPTAKLHVSGTTNLAGNTTITGNNTVSGKTTTASLKVTGGTPGTNKVLVSDADGDATWQDLPSHTKSIVINPGMFPSEAFSGSVTRGTLGGFGLPVIRMNDGANTEIRISIPMPVDWNGSSMTAKLLYSSSATGGVIAFKGGRIYRSLNEDVSDATTSNNFTMSVSTTAEGLQEEPITISVANSSDKFVFMYFRRRGGDAADTNTGTLYIHGINLEYTTN